MPYVRFTAMIAISTVILFALTYLTTYSATQIHVSETRIYMALLMGAAISLIMLVFMRDIYTHRVINACIVGVSVGVFFTSLWLIRSQRAVDDVDYMREMIPHHSIALMTSNGARIRNPRVRRLADRILATELREIREMEGLIRELKANPPPRGAPVLPPSNPGLSYLPEGDTHDLGVYWSPAGYWAEAPDLCARRYWLLTRTSPASVSARTCVVRPREGGEWTAECDGALKAKIVQTPRLGGEQIQLSSADQAFSVTLSRCGLHSPGRNMDVINGLRAEAAAIDRLVSSGQLVRHGVLSADDIFLVQAWRQDGEVVKIIAPIGSGPAAGQDREYYFRPGQNTPFLIKDPFSISVFTDGRSLAWLDAGGEMISDFAPEVPSPHEGGLLTEAAALKDLAIPPAARAAEASGAPSTKASPDAI